MLSCVVYKVHLFRTRRCLLFVYGTRTDPLPPPPPAAMMLEALGNTHRPVLANTPTHWKTALLVTIPCWQSANKRALRSPS